MDMSEILKSNFIRLDLESSCKEDTIKQLIDLAFEEGIVLSKEELYKSVMERETACTTNIMEKIAIPHAKSDAVKQAAVIFGRSDKGIKWCEDDGEDDKVYLVFLIMVPSAQAGNEHLKILSVLARCLSHVVFRENLLKAKNKTEINEIIDKQMKVCACN